MLRWLRRRWRRLLPLCGLAAVLVFGVHNFAVGLQGDGEIDAEFSPGDRDMDGLSPAAANMVFRKSLQAFSEKDGKMDTVKSPAELNGLISPPNPVKGHDLRLQQPSPQEPKFKIYVYDLPSRFNTNLTECVQNHSDGCYKISEFGMGPELRRHDYLTYRDTAQISLEVIVHEKMLKSRFRTLDANKADAFYIPFYAGLACTCRTNIGQDLTELYADLWRHLARTSPYFGDSGVPRRPHFMTLGEIEREFWTSGCPFLRDVEGTQGITCIGVEEEVNEELKKYFKRTRRRMIVAPYPSYGHFDSSYSQSLDVRQQAEYPSDVRKTTRDVRVFMAVGSRKAHDLRVILKRHMTGTSQRYSKFTASSSKSRRYAVWYSTPECRRDMQLPIVDWMRHSVFCLQPPGDSLTRKAFYDAVMAGCIPVTFKPKKSSVSVAYPFQDRLDYSRFSVNIPMDDVLSGSVRVLERLRIIPESRIANMQQRLAEAAPKLQYSFPPTSEAKDAFSMIVDEMKTIAA